MDFKKEIFFRVEVEDSAESLEALISHLIEKKEVVIKQVARQIEFDFYMGLLDSVEYELENITPRWLEVKRPLCPVCLDELDINTRHCPSCGKKINWEKE